MTSATQRLPSETISNVASPSRKTSTWSFARNVAVLGGGAALAQAFSVVLAPVLTRLYSPESIGQFGIFASFLNVSLVVVSLKYELGIMATPTEEKAAQLTIASFLLAIPMSLLAAGALGTMMHFSLLGFGVLPSYAPAIMGLILIFGGAFYALRYWFVRQEQFTGVSRALVAQGGVRTTLQVVFGALGAKLGGLLGGEMLGRCAGMMRMYREGWPQIRARVFPLRREGFREVLRENWRFPVYSFPSTLVDSLSSNICIPLIVLYYGARAGGYYALVQRVLAVPFVLIGTSVADAFHGRVAVYARDTPKQVSGLFRKTGLWLFLLGLVPALFLGFYGQPVFKFVFGGEWGLAGEMAAVISPLFLAQFVVSPLSRLVFVLQGQRVKLIYDALALASMIGVFVFAAWRGWGLIEAVAMLSLTGTLTTVVYYFILMVIVAKHSRSIASPA
ncbi:MAG TPA: oligosaccharide flippase family protein [Candidatus Acidoferrales bacterium]|nr:oligosaccharide flippase family protein [Candidatus Acidoferrales bacterium]